MEKDLRKTIHAIDRCFERYGIFIDTDDILIMEEAIRNNKSRAIRTRSNTVTEHAVRYNDVTFSVLYNKRLKQIVTLLPPEPDFSLGSRFDVKFKDELRRVAKRTWRDWLKGWFLGRKENKE